MGDARYAIFHIARIARIAHKPPLSIAMERGKDTPRFYKIVKGVRFRIKRHTLSITDVKHRCGDFKRFATIKSRFEKYGVFRQ